jgi:hypothetical protein
VGPSPAHGSGRKDAIREGTLVRQTVKRTLAVLATLVAIAVVAQIALDATSSNTPRNADSGPVRLAAGGQRSNPVPLHTVGGVWNGWRLRVRSVTPNAVMFLGHDRLRTPAGGRELMVSIAVTYGGRGQAGIRGLLRRLYVDGSHSAYYAPDSGDLNCAASATPSALDRPLNESRAVVPSRRHVRGHVCFEISANDAGSLVLYVDRPGCNTSKTHDNCDHRVWFALK